MQLYIKTLLPFNNMQTQKFKSKLKITFFTAVDHNLHKPWIKIYKIEVCVIFM